MRVPRCLIKEHIIPEIATLPDFSTFRPAFVCRSQHSTSVSSLASSRLGGQQPASGVDERPELPRQRAEGHESLPPDAIPSPCSEAWLLRRLFPRLHSKFPSLLLGGCWGASINGTSRASNSDSSSLNSVPSRNVPSPPTEPASITPAKPISLTHRLSSLIASSGALNGSSASVWYRSG